ncbi:hypothetical protein GLU26_00020 [Nanohaloarchaea archaeon]|nr:hypothetical protein [Candidatus Nanohaloarchaea archaeon]
MKQEELHKTRVAYRLGAKTDDIAEYTGIEEEMVEAYLQDQDIDQGDIVDYDIDVSVDPITGEPKNNVREQISEMAIDTVKEVYDNWSNIEELPERVRQVSSSDRYGQREDVLENDWVQEQIANVFGEEEHGEEYDKTERQDLTRTSMLGFPDESEGKEHVAAESDEELGSHPEQSAKTFLDSQRYATAGEATDTQEQAYSQALEWFADRREGTVSAKEASEFLQFALNYETSENPVSGAEKLVRKNNKLNLIGTVTQEGDGRDRFELGDNLYQLTSEPEVNSDLEELLENSMEGLEEKVSEKSRSRGIRTRMPEVNKILGSS